MAKKHTINIPGVMLDKIRDDGDYENDERFTKRRKIVGKSVFNRKENRKQERLNKRHQKNENKAIHKAKAIEVTSKFKNSKKKTKSKNSNVDTKSEKKNPIVKQKKNKKSVSFSGEDQIREIPPRENRYDTDEDDLSIDNDGNIDMDFEQWERDFVDDSEDSEQYLSALSDDSQDEEDQKGAHDLIETLKNLKKVQRGEWNEGEEEEEEESELDDEQKDIMSQLAALKGKRSKSDIKIVKEDELADDSNDSESNDDDSTDGSSGEEESELDDEQKDIMKQLAALKGKRSKSDIKIIKEDELDDDSSDSENNDGFPSEEEELDDEQKGIMKQLAALKGKRSKSDIKIVKEDELDDDSIDEESQSDNDNSIDSESDSEDAETLDKEQQDIMEQLKKIKGKRSNTDIKIVKEDDLDDDSFDEEEQSETESDNSSENEEEYAAPPSSRYDDDDISYYASKLGIDPSSSLSQDGDDDLVGGLFEGLDFIKESSEKKEKKEKEKEKEKRKAKKKIEEEEYAVPIDLDSKKDEEEMEYYARKLGIDPKKGLNKQDNFDDIGGLFEGLEKYEGRSGNEEMTESESEDNEKTGNDDSEEVNSDDFDDDDDLDDDDKALLKEMYGLESSDSESDYESELEEGQTRVKENPYIAPGQNDENTNTGKYIPPALRKRLEGENEELSKITRLIKGPFNKLSEPTLINVISEINKVYEEHPRQYANEAILNILLKSIITSTPMLDTFLILYSSAVVGMYKLVGVEFGAYIIQKLTEKLIEGVEGGLNRQENINLTGFIGYLYSLNFVNCGLIYDIIKEKLIKDTNELKTDVLLKLVKSCGRKLRADDSNALTNIINELNKSIVGKTVNVRTRFLIDTILDLKNNRIKNENENANNMLNRIKKQLGSIGKGLDSIKVSLDDIENIEERGKWWLVGSAWKGKKSENDENFDLVGTKEGEEEEDEENGGMSNGNIVINDFKDEMLTDEPNWMELAKSCGMNTDIRRAIFISIMSAEDFMDSFVKLEKLNLKKSQKKEIPNILLHCATMEQTYNPYYAYLSKKLCDDHSLRRDFQLNLWDFIKEIEGEEGDEEETTSILINCDEDTRLWKIVNLGRFYGFLIGEGSLQLNVLRVVNFLTATSDVKIFIEMILVAMIEDIAKKSVISGKGKNAVFGDRLIKLRASKCEEQPLLRKGLVYFLEKHVATSPLCGGSGAHRHRLLWGVDALVAALNV